MPSAVANTLGLSPAGFELYDAGDGPGSGIRLIDPDAADLGTGDGFTLTYTATVLTGVAQDASLAATADLTWSSLDGVVPGERDGVDGPGGTLDDYAAATSTAVSTGQVLDLATRVLTPAGDGTATIGESVTYELVLTVPQGTTEATTLTIDLPDGLVADPATAVLAAGNAGLATQFAGAASFAAGPGNTLTVTLGDVVNPDNGTAGDETVTLTFDALVADDPARHTNGVALNATATATTTSGAAPTAVDNLAGFTVTEPALTLEKTVDNPTPRLGEAVAVTLDASHAAGSTAAAQDLVLSDALAPGLTLDAGSVVVLVDGSPVAGLVTTGNGPGDTAVRVDLSSLALGADVRVTYAATVTSSLAAFGDGLDTAAGLAWDTLAADDAGVDGPDRDYAVADGPDTPTVVSGADLSVTVDDGAADREPGDAFSYTVRVENHAAANALDARGVVVTAVVPEGLTFAGTTGGASPWASYDPATAELTSTPRGIAAGSGETLAVPVTVDDAASSGRDGFTLSAAATQQDLEPTPADNAAADADTLTAAPDYRVTVTDSVSASGPPLPRSRPASRSRTRSRRPTPATRTAATPWSRSSSIRSRSTTSVHPTAASTTRPPASSPGRSPPSPRRAPTPRRPRAAPGSSPSTRTCGPTSRPPSSTSPRRRPSATTAPTAPTRRPATRPSSRPPCRWRPCPTWASRSPTTRTAPPPATPWPTRWALPTSAPARRRRTPWSRCGCRRTC